MGSTTHVLEVSQEMEVVRNRLGVPTPFCRFHPLLTDGTGHRTCGLFNK